MSRSSNIAKSVAAVVITSAAFDVAIPVVPAHAADDVGGNTRQTATYFATPGSVSDTLDTWLDEDWWAFELPCSDMDEEYGDCYSDTVGQREVSVTLDSLPADYDLSVFDEYGYAPDIVSDDTGLPGTASERIEFVGDPGQRLTVRVKSGNGASNLTQPYRLTVSWLDAQPDQNSGNCGNATPMSVPGVVSNFNRDSDCWRFLLTQRVVLSAAYSHPKGKPESLTLRDARGNRLASTSTATSLKQILGPGAYSIEVNSSDRFRAYSLQLSTSPVIEAPSAPRSVKVSPSRRRATVSWRPPATSGGAPISTFEAVAKPGGSSCRNNGRLSCTVIGLKPKKKYRFVVRATNAAGTGPRSQPSRRVRIR